jgi:hypothetical protein
MERDMDDERRPSGRPGTVLGRALVAALLALAVGPLGVASAAEPEEAPVVTTQPVSQEVTEPGSATFTAAASGTPAPTVQWEVAEFGEFFLELPGATSDTLTIESPTTGQNGFKYRAKFTNSVSTVETNWATLTVNPAPVAPAILTQPTSQEVNEHGTATFTASASGIPTPTIQWQVLPTGGGTWADVPGATSETLNVAKAMSSESGNAYRAVFTNTVSTATSASATLTVNSPPQVKSSPSNEVVLVGKTATFAATASGTPAPTVQWEESTNKGATFNNVPGATSGILTVQNATLGESGDRYRAVFTNKAGSATSSEATLTVESIPTVTASPSDQTVLEGETATFTASATGAPPPTVQWEVSTDKGANFKPLAGATSPTLTIKKAVISESGHKYRAVFSNVAGTVTSEPATLTVHAGPVVTANPANVTVLAGGTATFTASASGTPAPAVQWQYSTNSGLSWEPDTIDGGNTTGTLAVAAANVAQNGYEYRAAFTNTVGTTTSAAATLTVHAAPAVTANPTSITVLAGEPATFSAAASGTPTPTVQWQVSTNGSTWANDTTDSGVATNTLTLGSVALAQSGTQYRAVFTNVVGSAPSAAATLTVNAPPVVTTNPVSKGLLTGEGTTFTAAAAGTPTPTVQWELSKDFGATWEKDTSDSGSTTGKLTVTASSVAMNGYEYHAVFANSAGTATSTPATLTVTEKTVAPVVTADPTNQSLIAGEGATFTATASGVPTPTVQWQVSKDGGKTFSNDTSDPGHGTGTLTVLAVPVEKNGYEYEAVFTNVAGKAISKPAKLIVEKKLIAPTVTTQPMSKVVNAGEATTFTAAAAGVPTPTVQWERSTNSGVTWTADTSDSGNTTETLSVPPTNAGQNGTEYRAVFKNTVGTAESTAATLTVLAAPSVTIEPVSTTVIAGEPATFTAAASGTPAPTVQWQVSTDGSTWANDNTDSGSTTTTLTVSSAALARNGYQYRAVFTNVVSAATSAAATLTVAPRPVARAAPVAPVASFSWFPSSPHIGERVSLASNSTDVDSPITASAWDLAGNGPFVPGSSVLTTTFATPGSHTVRLRVTDATGLTNVATQRIQVSAAPLFLMQPFPVVRIAGSDSALGVTLRLVAVQAPIGAHITVTCRGHGCPTRSVSAIAVASKKKRGGPAAVVAFRRFERSLRAGVTLEIRITKAGQIGKYTGFTIRRGKLPVRVDMCLSPGASQPMVCPSS